MKILFVCPSLTKGGAERVVSTLANELSRAGHEVIVAMFDDKVEYDCKAELLCHRTREEKRPPHILKAALRIPKQIYWLRKIYFKNNIDIMFSFMEIANFIAICSRLPVIVSIRTNPDIIYGWFVRLLIKVMYKRSNVRFVVTPSVGVKDILFANYGIDNVRVIHNPLPFEFITKMMNEPLEFKKPYILSVGRLEKEKGFSFLIETYSKFDFKKHFDLIILGEGRLRQELESLVNARGLKGRVHLLGNSSNPFRYYLNARAFILSSYVEGFPNVLIEALSCGCFCISSNCEAGRSSIIRHRENGLLFDVGDEESLKTVLDEMAHDSVLRSKIIQNARTSVLHLDVKFIAKRWIDLASEVNSKVLN